MNGDTEAMCMWPDAEDDIGDSEHGTPDTPDTPAGKDDTPDTPDTPAGKDDTRGAVDEDNTNKRPSPEQLAAFRKDVDEAVHHLQRNTCLELRGSRISTRGDGIGVFARESVSAGQTTWIPIPPMVALTAELMTMFPDNLRTTMANRCVLDNVIPSQGTHIVGVVTYVNHRNIPNATIADGKLTFTHNVRRGHEVTIDYRATDGFENKIRCATAGLVRGKNKRN